ncbi:MAG: hypothetical protein Unbinned6224contig1001_5 [Prokaryotic dsDNA virus sp.]|nr:MAG: hypothetical protein Unbinned6224contig1001_5 [Prokaryotic dsDNA virus sp.]|tara:strand:- start:7194 stop:7625 length:432 start_codon:yes stop_codon:yes gene_type:complete
MPTLKLNLSADQVENIIQQLRYGKNSADTFDIDLLRGLNGEVQALDILQGKLEVKTDFKAHKTGNLAIEIQCNGKDSGLLTSTANWWLFLIKIKDSEPMMVIITKKRLTKLVMRHLHKNHFVMGGDQKKSKLVIIPVEEVICG